MKKNRLNLSLLLLFISIGIFLLLFFRLEPDYFWHIKAGEYMFKNGVITHDVFSWFVSGKYWFSHEWLFEIIIYALKLIFKSIHPLIYCFICLTSMFTIMFFSNKKNILKNIPYTLMYLMFIGLLMIPYIQVRPHMISNIFVLLSVYFLYDLYKNKDSKKIYLLPIITIIWSNIHGGSSNLSYILCFIFLISGLFSFKFKKIENNKLSKKQLYKYLIVMILCMIGVCINIHGVKMFIYPYSNMMDTTMLNNISEWQPTNLNNIFHYSYFMFIIFMVITMLISDKKIKLIDLLLLGFCTYLGLKSVRFWLYSPIFMYYVIYDYVKERDLDKGVSVILIIISITLLSIFTVSSNKLFSIKYKFALNSEVIDVIKREKPNRLFNMYDYGGELVYSDIPVFIDGRADLYSKYNYKDYLDISNGKNDYVSLIKKYDFDYLLIDKKYPIYTYIRYSNDYEIVYESKKIILYKKIVN